MKKTILFFAILCVFNISGLLYGQSGGQENTKDKFEFNLGLANLFSKEINWINTYYTIDPRYQFLDDYDISDMYGINPKFGIGFKYLLKKGAIRANIFCNFKNKSETSTVNDNQHTDYIDMKYNLSNIVFSLGYEWRKNLNKVQVYYGADLFINDLRCKDDQTLTYDPNYHNNFKTVNNTNYSKTGYGLSPFLGLKYYITPNLSISTEAKFNFEKFQSKTEENQTYVYLNSTDDIKLTNSNSKGYHGYFSPVGLISINIQF